MSGKSLSEKLDSLRRRAAVHRSKGNVARAEMIEERVERIENLPADEAERELGVLE